MSGPETVVEIAEYAPRHVEPARVGIGPRFDTLPRHGRDANGKRPGGHHDATVAFFEPRARDFRCLDPIAPDSISAR